MCGRFTITSEATALAQHFALPSLGALSLPRFNVAPSQRVPLLRLDPFGQRELALVVWGLVPAWVRDPRGGARPINARGESVEHKPFFRQAWRRQRGLVLADGFYEWQRGGGGKQPFWLHRPDRGPLAFAALWERWRAATGGEPIESCTLITTTANAVVRPLHDRMPVILQPDDYARWLAPASADALAALKALLVPAPDDLLQAVAVTRYVNDPQHDDPACLAPALPSTAERP